MSEQDSNFIHRVSYILIIILIKAILIKVWYYTVFSKPIVRGWEKLYINFQPNCNVFIICFYVYMCIILTH